MEITKEPNKTPVKAAEILVFGGSFSPPTIGHVALIETALKTENYDEIWVMPCRDRIDKVPTANEVDRLKMLEMTIAEYFPNQPVYVSDFEYQLPLPSKTYLTHTALQDRFPNNHFTYLIGEDSLATMKDWEYGQELLTELNWLVAPREAAPEVTEQPENVTRLAFAELPISSTEVRRMVAEGQSITCLVANDASKYINKKGLYK